MINFFYETDFKLENEDALRNWISEVIVSETYSVGEIAYVFCDDAYLHALNVEYLNHDTLTDIISFDYSLGKEVHGEIYVSVERVDENAQEFKTGFIDELHRVMIHGVLHYCGYKDKSEEEEREMRERENTALKIRSFV